MQSDKTDSRNQQKSIDFNSFYPPMFPPSSSISPSDCSVEDDVAIENCLNQARLALEYQQLYNRYAMCLSHLQESLKEIHLLRESNETIRMTNTDLVKRLNLLQNCLLPPSSLSSFTDDFNRLGLEGDSPTSVIEQRNRLGPERVTLPKSISVRSSGYVKLPPQRSGGSGVPSRGHRVNSAKNPGLSGSQRVCVPAAGGEKENESLEFEVYNQGMFKTELCNKWQETGACPYGDNCQFAHGITELRPVIRHPRYKTEVCRMVLSGDNCPYGHRCHFRHSLTEEEKLLGPLGLSELNR